jgi:hypothetical protein
MHMSHSFIDSEFPNVRFPPKIDDSPVRDHCTHFRVNPARSKPIDVPLYNTTHTKADQQRVRRMRWHQNQTGNRSPSRAISIAHFSWLLI